ncbi:E3 ubiquitin-protein ligase MARCH7 isoform X2 [Syngnathus acus]|uniref:E3 ubiquitin-protein ligase MARCH7 isoform X2 n=1 Tax=Syngnathus acus TaxID=161584 RepID=UPI001885F9A8|nr:E3 ubiquitin-protein ligase MARCH7 isoform X2 [Syngnathus acus]
MDSRSLRLPFCLSSSKSSYTSSSRASSSSSSSSSSAGSRWLYSRETLPHLDHFPRVSSTYKADVDQKSSRLPSSSRDYSSSDSRNSWKPLTSSTRSYERPWAESLLSSRTKLTDPEENFGRSSLLPRTDDGDNKRAKLTYSSRGLYSNTPSTSQTGSTYSSSGFNNARGIKEKPSESSWTSSHFLSRSSPFRSKPLLPNREVETPNEPGLSELRDGRARFQELKSLYHTSDRLTSTYAQGARPKDSAYSSCSFTAERERSPGGHVASTSSAHRFSTPRDYNSRPSTRVLNASSSYAPFQEQPSSRRRETPLPSTATSDGGDRQRRTSTRHLLSRLLFSPRSSQDSSSSSSSSSSGPSVDDDSLSLESDEGAGTDAEPASHGTGTRQCRADLSPIWEDKNCGVAGARVASPREPQVMSREAASDGNSRLSSSLRSRCSPLLSRLQRHARGVGAQSSAGQSRPQHLLRRWDNREPRVPQNDDEDEDDDEDEEEQGAVGLNHYTSHRRQEELPHVEETLAGLAQRRRGDPLQNESTRPQVGPERTLDVAGSKQEKLRIIKERLLLEDSDEDEGDLCRICQMAEVSASNPLIQPCRCTGSLQYVHQDCIKRWLCSKLGSATNMEAITTCELCKEKLRLNIDNFDIQQLYRTHAQFKYDDFISRGVQLVVLLHLFEQRFADVLGAIDTARSFNLIFSRKVSARNKTTDLLLTSLTRTTTWTRNTDHDNLLAGNGKLLKNFFHILDIVAVGRNCPIFKIAVCEIRELARTSVNLAKKR